MLLSFVLWSFGNGKGKKSMLKKTIVLKSIFMWNRQSAWWYESSVRNIIKMQFHCTCIILNFDIDVFPPFYLFHFGQRPNPNPKAQSLSSRDLGLEAGIWASRLRYGPRGWGEGRYREGGGREEGEGENSPYVWMHRSTTPLRPLPKKDIAQA